MFSIQLVYSMCDRWRLFRRFLLLAKLKRLIMLRILTVLSKSPLTNSCTVKAVSLVLQKKTFCTRMDDKALIQAIRDFVPKLSNDKHKGQVGRIGVFGGSVEYTGAPYFAAISCLKVGADTVHVICMKDAASVIKSYSPELIVLPHLDAPNAPTIIEPWLEKLHVILIGPGLGRELKTFQTIESIITICREKRKPLVIDADGLFFISQKPEILSNYPVPVILTPNAFELNRLIGYDPAGTADKQDKIDRFMKVVGPNVTLLCKGREDEIISNGQRVKDRFEGSGRRCGGQGDILAGSVSIFLHWALQKPVENQSCDNRVLLAAYAACRLVGGCNASAFAKFGRSMLATDMIQEIHTVFAQQFECDS